MHSKFMRHLMKNMDGEVLDANEIEIRTLPNFKGVVCNLARHFKSSNHKVTQNEI